MTLNQLLCDGTEVLRRSGIQEAELDARRLLMEAFETDMAHFLMDRMRLLKCDRQTELMEERYHQMIEERAGRVPLQYILGKQEFMGMTFKVNPHVLIPRQDTETLVELVLEDMRGGFLLDLCTGSGCIAISLAVKGDFQSVTATDVSADALKVAEENAGNLLGDDWEINGAAGRRFNLYQGDLFAALPKGTTYDILVSNPPYIPTEVIRELQPEVRDNEPDLALNGYNDGLAFYRRIAAEAPVYLNPGAVIYLEIGHDQANAVSQLLAEAGFSNIEIFKDLPGLDRVVRASI